MTATSRPAMAAVPGALARAAALLAGLRLARCRVRGSGEAARHARVVGESSRIFSSYLSTSLAAFSRCRWVGPAAEPRCSSRPDPGLATRARLAPRARSVARGAPTASRCKRSVRPAASAGARDLDLRGEHRGRPRANERARHRPPSRCAAWAAVAMFSRHGEETLHHPPAASAAPRLRRRSRRFRAPPARPPRSLARGRPRRAARPSPRALASRVLCAARVESFARKGGWWHVRARRSPRRRAGPSRRADARGPARAEAARARIRRLGLAERCSLLLYLGDILLEREQRGLEPPPGRSDVRDRVARELIGPDHLAQQLVRDDRDLRRRGVEEVSLGNRQLPRPERIESPAEKPRDSASFSSLFQKPSEPACSFARVSRH